MDLQTGHPEIDAQHQHLVALVDRLEGICQLVREQQERCSRCPASHVSACSARLEDLLADLLGFMFDHFSYEEKLMRLLPSTPDCVAHVEEHQYAHAEISRLLSELIVRLGRDEPKSAARQLKEILGLWLGGHHEAFDQKLAISLSGAYEAEIELDMALSKLLVA